jgi:signal transduction histidine kinase/DNA-binding response OmpR family regulator/streptogramin lyase
MNSLVAAGGNIACANGKMYVKRAQDEHFVRLPFAVNALCTYPGQKMVGIGPRGIYLFSSDGRRVLGRCKISFEPTVHTSIYYSRNSHLVYVGNGIGQRSRAFRITGNIIVPAVGAYVPDGLMDVTDYGRGIVFGIDGGGIVVSTGSTVKRYTPANSSLGADAVYSLLNDRGGNLWVGTYRAGVSMLSQGRNWFRMLNRSGGAIPYDIVTAVVPSADNIYMGLDGGGLCIYNSRSGTSRTLTTANSNIAGNNVISMQKDGDRLWMAIYTKGLTAYDISTGKFTLYPMPAGSAGNSNVWTICDDGMGRIWVGGPDLMIFVKRTRRFITRKYMLGMDCASIACHGNVVWIGTNNRGIYKMDRRTLKILAHYTTSSKDITLAANSVRQVFVDASGHLWFSLYYAGFYCLDTKTDIMREFGADDGLANTYVTSVTEEHSGMMWMGTFDGLYRYNPRTRTFIRFGAGDNIASTFTYDAAASDGGMMYFGSTKGLLMFRPSVFHYRQRYDVVNFLSLDLQNEDHRTFNLYGQSAPEISLAHDQNFFSIKFSVPEIDSPNRVHFSCYLKGLEKAWREMGGSRQVEYTNVPPGTYQFFVRCTDSDGRWSQPSVLTVIVSPPWYATWWARLLWTLIVLCVIIIALKFYLHEIDIKHRVQIVEVQRNTMKRLNEAKMNFYTLVTHELRTPVFLIAAQIEELVEKRTSIVTVPQSYLESMYRNSQKLNRLISRVIDFRKMDAEKMVLNLQRRNVVEFCNNLSEDYESLCNQKDIKFSFACGSSDIQLNFDLDKLETILTNLVSNAFKYTREGGAVSLSLTDRPDDVVFAVTDNGIGIVEKMHEAIFRNFVRTKRGEAENSGDGVGLATVKNLVELHGGEIHVDSETGLGSCFTFNIPKNLKDDNIENEEAEPRTVDEESSGEKEILHPMNPAALHSILIIDDERDTVDLLERNLASDFKVYKAYDGEEGLQVARAELPDIIVCDLMMPRMDGMQFLQTLKNDKMLQHIKVIIFTAKTAEDDMIEAFDSGADAYLTKPISLKYLRTRIDRMVAQNDNAAITSSISKEKKTYNKEEQIFLLRCREIIDDNLKNEDFNIDMLADRLAMSHSSLYKKIKAMTGMSLIEFINDYKIYHAVELMRQGQTNIDAVCEQCGFNDAKNFRQIFKRKMGMSPKQYVQQL